MACFDLIGSTHSRLAKGIAPALLLSALFLSPAGKVLAAKPVEPPPLPPLPEEWRLPDEGELASKWRGGKEKHAQVNGDFNGDGVPDVALMVVKADDSAEGLLAFMTINNEAKWFILDQHKITHAVSMGLDLYKPGKYKVICATAAECKQGYKREITFATDTLVYYRPDSASYIFSWNNEAGKFERIWETDHRPLGTFGRLK